jgi:2,4-dienoyl-CoA reductase-like NADH-dependent reductase (Old Yellow Enzyme family)/thioredoxin reductase
MSFENLLRPGKINSMSLRNRLIAGPMEKSLANLDGSLNERYIAYTRERARGGAALIQLESTYVSADGQGNPYQVGIHGDHVIPGLTRMAEAVHEHGAKFAMELHHGGRQASATTHFRQPIAPSAIPSKAMDPGSIPREMTPADIRRVIDDFAYATERCLKAGVDMIHMHGAHGYLLGQFLSPQSNHRHDQYGGSLENRARFALEILATIRAIVGADYPIGYRISAQDYVDDGLEIHDSVKFAVMLADAGIDLIDVAGGTYESMPMIFQWADAPKGGFIPEARAIRQAVGSRVPVSVAQRLKDPAFANQVMAEEGFDFISLTRAFHADPYYVQKLIAGQPGDIVPCISCNTCVNLTGSRQPTGCAVNPEATYEAVRTFRKVPAPKRVMVIGGGFAGLQAARMLAMQGHQVSLFEADSHLGGQITASRAVMPDYGLVIDWLVRQMTTLAVSVSLNQTVTIEDVQRLNPDAVVVAAGARAKSLHAQERDVDIPYFDVFSALKRTAGEWGGAVAIIGGDMASCMVAKHLGQQNVKVHLIESSAAFATDWQFNGTLLTTELQASKNIVLYPETTAERISGNQVEIQTRGTFKTLTVNAVVVGGREPNISLSEALKRADLSASVYTIGDAVRVRDLYTASQEAAQAAEKISLS